MQSQHVNSQFDLAASFFQQVVGIELALMRTGFHRGDGPAEPDWDGFAKSPAMLEYFNKQYTDDLGEAIKFLQEQPPKKAIIENGVIKWRKIPENGTVSEKLCRYVQRTRSNLFQTAQSNDDWNDPERCELLLRHSVRILEGVLEASPKVAKAYYANN